MEKGMGKKRKIYKEDLHNFDSSPSINRIN
jgi:hypothetical protein